MDTIAAVIASVGGGAGLATVLATIFSYRKFKNEAETTRIKNAQTEMDYIKESFKEIAEETKRQFNEFKESSRVELDELKSSNEELREANKDLKHQIDVMAQKLSSLMNWIISDDQRYRTWLENKVHELDPSIEFPEHTAPPNVFDDDDEAANNES